MAARKKARLLGTGSLDRFPVEIRDFAQYEIRRDGKREVESLKRQAEENARLGRTCRAVAARVLAEQAAELIPGRGRSQEEPLPAIRVQCCWRCLRC